MGCSVRRGRSRVQLCADEQPKDEQIVAAKAVLEERRRLQDLAFRTRQARLDPIVRALHDEVFDRLRFDDPTGNVKDAIARYPYNAVIAGIATFEGKRDAGTLPPDVGPRYLLGIVRHVAERDEGLAIAEHLWRLRLSAQDAALARLDDARLAHVGAAAEQVRSFIDHALADHGPLVRSFWLTAAADVLQAAPKAERHAGSRPRSAWTGSTAKPPSGFSPSTFSRSPDPRANPGTPRPSKSTAVEKTLTIASRGSGLGPVAPSGCGSPCCSTPDPNRDPATPPRGCPGLWTSQGLTCAGTT